MDYRSIFIQWYYNEFQLDKLYVDMCDTVEDSPWHRERSVGTHTDMVVAQYIALSPDTWSITDLYGAFVCAFHDVGKPSSRQEKYKPERGTYYGYSGHELASARLWEDYAARNWKSVRTTFDLSEVAIYAIGWMIENHRPWGTTKPDALNQISSTIDNVSNLDVFLRVLTADNWGRIGDNHAENQQKSQLWMDNFAQSHVSREKDSSPSLDLEKPVLMIVVGASGSGKSTFYSTKLKSPYEHYSLDALRLRWYGEPYSSAFTKSCEDNNFESKAQKEFMSLLKEGKNIYVDNTNTSRKRRAYYIREARRKGYTVVAVLLPVALQTVIDRQSTRGDKTVPADAVRRQYISTAYPHYGEVDYVMIDDGNLPK